MDDTEIGLSSDLRLVVETSTNTVRSRITRRSPRVETGRCREGRSRAVADRQATNWSQRERIPRRRLTKLAVPTTDSWRETSLEGSDLRDVDDIATHLLIDSMWDRMPCRKFRVRPHLPCSLIDAQKIRLHVKKYVQEPARESNVIAVLLSNLRIRPEAQVTYMLRHYLQSYKRETAFEIVPTLRNGRMEGYNFTVLAKQAIGHGTVIPFLTGQIIDGETCDDTSGTFDNALSTIMLPGRSKARKHGLVGSVRFVNHGCKPNARFHPQEPASVGIKTLRDITIGEAITVAYSSPPDISYFAPGECRCDRCCPVRISEPATTTLEEIVQSFRSDLYGESAYHSHTDTAGQTYGRQLRPRGQKATT